MKIYVYVEGPSDRNCLDALWAEWKIRLGKQGWGISVLDLHDKAMYFRKIGDRVSEKLVYDSNDLVIGLPDLYPYRCYDSTEFKHKNMAELAELQKRLVKDSLCTRYNIKNPEDYLSRFLPSGMKHDLEVLLLAATEQLKKKLCTTESLKDSWRHPPEEQNHDRPPKRIIEELFKTKLKVAYRDTIHGPSILKNAKLRDLIFSSGANGAVKCPEFKKVLDWISNKTQVQAYVR